MFVEAGMENGEWRMDKTETPRMAGNRLFHLAPFVIPDSRLSIHSLFPIPDSRLSSQ